MFVTVLRRTDIMSFITRVVSQSIFHIPISILLFADLYAGLDWSYVPEYIPEKKDVDELKRLLLEPEVNKEKDEDDIDMEITWEIGKFLFLEYFEIAQHCDLLRVSLSCT